MLVAATSSEESEVVDGVAGTNHPVVRRRLVHLYRCHTQAQHACLSILRLNGHVVVQRHVHAKQWRERLVDAHCRHVVHRVRCRHTGGCIGDEAESAHILHERAVRRVGTYGVHTLVRVVDVDTLEHVAEPWQLRQTAVLYRPVGQQVSQRWEDRHLRAHIGVGCEERRHHHIGAVLVHSAVGSVELLACERRAGRIYRTGIPRLDTLTEAFKRVAEAFKRCRLVAVLCAARALECAAQRERCHGERSALSGRVAGIHILHLACRCLGTRCREVYLQVAHRLKRCS